jgi:hypothetical protein
MVILARLEDPFATIGGGVIHFNTTGTPFFTVLSVVLSKKF